MPGLVCLLAGGVLGASKLLGFDTVISWDLFQLLDREALARYPLASLLLLHSQPPLLNALAAVSLQLSSLLGRPPEEFVAALFLLLGAISAAGLYLTLLRLTTSRRWAVAGVVLLLADPGFYFFGHTLFYPFLLQFLMVALLWASTNYLASGRQLSLVILLLVAVVLTRSLFHPLWALSLLLLLAVLRGWLAGRSARHIARRLLVPLVVLAAALSLWPLKNYLLFGHFSYSSWTGFNLAKNLPVSNRTFQNYMTWGEVSRQTRAALSTFTGRFGDAARVIAAPRKTGGARNWNHLVMLEVDQALVREGIAWRTRNPGKWMARVGFHYHCWSLPTYFNPYDLESMLPRQTGIRQYESVYSALLYADLRPRGKTTTGVGKKKKMRVPFSIFGVAAVPLLLLAAAYLMVRDLRRKKLCGAVLAVSLFCTLWVLVIPCLTDGNEGNRMRFSVGPLMIVMLCSALNRLCNRVARSRHPDSGLKAES